MLSPTKPTEGPHRSVTRIEIGSEDSKSLTDSIEQFKNDHGIRFVLAFSGGADDDNPLVRHIDAELDAEMRLPPKLKAFLKTGLERSMDTYIATIIRDILMPLRGYRIAVLSGGTKWGVPRVAIEVARECGFPTIGVYPILAKGKHELPEGSLDLAVCVHPPIYRSEWGDEAGVYTKLLDSVVVIGGGAGTLVEMAKILKLNERKDITLKHIVPIYGTGGTADRMLSFPGKLKTMAACLPAHRITSGQQAFEYLTQTVLTEDIYEPAEKETT
jgi:hypothetical protein